MSDKEKLKNEYAEFDTKTFGEFSKFYLMNGLDPVDQLIKEDPDVWKLIELAAKSKKRN